MCNQRIHEVPTESNIGLEMTKIFEYLMKYYIKYTKHLKIKIKKGISG